MQPDILQKISQPVPPDPADQREEAARHEDDREHDHQAEEQRRRLRDAVGQHFVDRGENERANTGPSTVPGPPNIVMMTMRTSSVVSNAPAGSIKVIQ